MKRIMKKVISAVASMAMAAGLIAAIPALNVKAAPAENAPAAGTEIYIKGSYDGWASLTKMKNDGDVYTHTITLTEAKNIEYMFSSNSNYGAEGYFQIQNGSSSNFTYNAESAGEYVIKLDLSQGTWAVTVDEADKWGVGNPANPATKYAVDGATSVTQNAITAADIISKINDIGTVEFTDDCLSKIKAAEDLVAAYAGNTADITNLATLTAARAEYDELLAAANAAAAGKVTVYVKDNGWGGMNLYSWIDAEGGAQKLTGEWPGTAMTPCAKNDGWYKAEVNITALANIIFNYGTNQTATLSNVSKGTYWFIISENNYPEGTTVAPNGWVNENVPSVGDATPIIAVSALALLALAGVVVCVKKRTVTE